MIYISIIIPVYNAEKSLYLLYERLIAQLKKIDKKFEIIFIEDCGTDKSWDIICRLSKLDERVIGLRMGRNYGQHNALLCGIREAKGEVVLTIDDDLQHPPEEIPKLLEALDSRFDVVYGAPIYQQHGFFRNLASSLTKLALQRSMGAKNARNISAFRIFRTHLREAFSNYRSPNVSIDVLLSWGTTRFTFVNVKHEPREYGDSGYAIHKLISHAINMISGYSTTPLRLASFMGFGFALLGAAILLYVIVQWVIHGSLVPGFVFLASLIVIFSGAQLLAIGVIGEYLSRMYTRTMDQPSYVLSMSTKNLPQINIIKE